MRKDFIKISWLVFLLIFSACQKSNNSSGSSGLSSFLGDDTSQAVGLVNEANNDLKDIRKLYKDNQGKVAELQQAVADKDPVKVKTIASDLATQIDNGLTLGGNAVDKIKKAKDLNINSDFKQYLEMKQESLEKLLDAFDSHKQAAELLSTKFGATDPAEIDKIKLEYKTKVGNAETLTQEGTEKSQDANNFAKRVLAQKKAQ